MSHFTTGFPYLAFLILLCKPIDMPRILILLPFLFSLFSSPVVLGQIDFSTFPLDEFRLPDIDWKALEVEGNLDGSYSNINVKTPDRNRSGSFFSPGLGLDYERFVNRENRQAEYDVQFFGDFSSSRDKDELFNRDETERNLQQFLIANYDNRAYRGTKFTHTGMTFLSQYNYNRVEDRDNGGLSIFKSVYFSPEIRPAIGFGTGRLEPVSDVAVALFLLKDAVDIGLAASAISKEKVYAFASRMAQLRNERVLDFRRQRINELRGLYTFMQEQGLVLQDDPGFFTVLTDNWIFNRYTRNAGRRWTFLATPHYKYEFSNNQNSPFPPDKNHNDEIGLELRAEFTKQHPVNLYRDRGRTHSLAVDVIDEERQGPFTFFIPRTYLQATLSNSITRDWFPNNRTEISAGLEVVYTYYKILSETIEEDDQHVASGEIRAQANYFISYQTRVVASAFAGYAYSTGRQFVVPIGIAFGTNLEASGWNAGIDISLLVSIF